MQRRIDRRAFLDGLCATGVGALGGCAAVGGSGGTGLRVGTLQPPVTLDPVAAASTGSRQVIRRVFDGLYDYGTGTDVHPKLATGPPTRVDDRTVRVELDHGARFQNGDPVTAADVAYSLRAPVEEDAPAKAAVSALESVAAVDDRTVRLDLAHPDPTLGRALTRPVVPRDAREADRDAFGEDPVGAGPFEVRNFEAETRAALSRWADYWDDPTPPVDEVTFVAVESPVTQTTGLASGRTDVVEPVSPQVADSFRDVTGGTVAAESGFRSLYFGFNANEGPTTDPDVREAIARCIDLDGAVEAFVEPFGRRQYGPVAPAAARGWDLPREEWRSMAPEKDLDRARDLFARAEEPVGRLTILTPPDPRRREFGERLARGLRDAGRAGLVDEVSWETYLDRRVSGAERDYAVFVGAVAGTADPDSYLYPVVHENMEGVTNGVFYNEEPVMEALSAARRTTDRERRTALYADATRRLLTETVIVPICTVQNSLGYRRPVSTVRIHPMAELNPRLERPDAVALSEEGR